MKRLAMIFALGGCVSAEKPDDKPKAPQTTETRPTETSEEKPAPPAPTALTTCYKATKEICSIERYIVAKTNQLRIQAGWEPFARSYEADYASRVWSAEMAYERKLSHDGFPAERAESLREEFDLTLPLRAENVAWFNGDNDRRVFAEMRGKADQKKMKFDEFVADFFVMTMWQNSEGHMKNMMGKYKSMGAGVSILELEGKLAIYATQLMHN
jgi:uncharacterized protein YkwD